MQRTFVTKLAAVLVGSLLCTALPHAQATEGLVRLGLDFGGEEMVSVYYSNGGDDEIKAGELIHLSGGFIFKTFADQPDWETQFTVGWKTDGITAENGTISFDRFPVEALQFIRSGNIRLGGGITLELNPTLKGDGVMSDLQVKFDDAWGGIVELDYLIGDKFMVGIRTTMIDYEIGGVTIDGSSVGFNMGFRF